MPEKASDLNRERAKLVGGKTWAEAFPEVFKEIRLKEGDILHLEEWIIVGQSDRKYTLQNVTDNTYLYLYDWQVRKLAGYLKNGLKHVVVHRGLKKIAGRMVNTTTFIPCSQDGVEMHLDPQTNRWIE